MDDPLICSPLPKNRQAYENPGLRKITGEVLRPGGIALTSRSIAYCALPPGSRILDIGCGGGASLRWLDSHGYQAIGCDISQRLLTECKNEELSVLLADGLILPFGAAICEAVIMECVLSVLSYDEQALAEVRRVLSPQGYLILSDLYARDTGEPMQPPASNLPGCLIGLRSRSDSTSKLVQSGFEILLWEDHSTALRDLAVKIIFTYGSLNAFYEECFSFTPQTMEPAKGISKLKPGYFLAVVRKM